MEIKIKTAEEPDTKEIVKLSHLLFKQFGEIDNFDSLDETAFQDKGSQFKEMKKMILSDDFLILKAVDGSRIVGYLGAEIKKRPHIWKIKQCGHINEVYVEQEYRKKGIARQMIEKALEWIKSKNRKYVTVGTHSAHELSNQFWINRGFKEYNKIFRKEV